MTDSTLGEAGRSGGCNRPQRPRFDGDEQAFEVLDGAVEFEIGALDLVEAQARLLRGRLLLAGEELGQGIAGGRSG